MASDGMPHDRFGVAVSLSGDTALVGSYLDDIGTTENQGSAHVFVRSGTTWTAQAKLTGDGVGGDIFGRSVSLSGDTALAGAPSDDILLDNQGSAYVFTRTGTTWSQQGKLVAVDAQAQAVFGSSVSVSGNAAIIGAPQHDVGANADQGTAYVFVRSGSIWSQQAKLTASDGRGGDRFGLSVAVDGNTAIVGASFHDVGANVDQGAVYVFVRSGTIWSRQAKLIASDGSRFDSCAQSVSLSGDTAIFGCLHDNQLDLKGSVYVFSRSGTTWSQQAKLTANDGVRSDNFGVSVSISGGTIVVGASDANFATGAAYLFLREGSFWSQRPRLTASDGAAFARFGDAVSVSGNTALIGAEADDIGTQMNQGSAYVFLLQ